MLAHTLDIPVYAVKCIHGQMVFIPHQYARQGVLFFKLPYVSPWRENWSHCLIGTLLKISKKNKNQGLSCVCKWFSALYFYINGLYCCPTWIGKIFLHPLPQDHQCHQAKIQGNLCFILSKWIFMFCIVCYFDKYVLVKYHKYLSNHNLTRHCCSI